MAHGRPYGPRYDKNKHPEQAKQFAKEGYLNKEIAAKMGIGHSAFCNWLNRHVEFVEALKEGREEADRTVEQALYKRTQGYKYEETEVVAEADKEGKAGKPIRIKKVEKSIAPDVTAQIFWLKNRKREEWRDVQEQKHSGTVTTIVEDKRESILRKLADGSARISAAGTPVEANQ